MIYSFSIPVSCVGIKGMAILANRFSYDHTKGTIEARMDPQGFITMKGEPGKNCMCDGCSLIFPGLAIDIYPSNGKTLAQELHDLFGLMLDNRPLPEGGKPAEIEEA